MIGGAGFGVCKDKACVNPDPSVPPPPPLAAPTTTPKPTVPPKYNPNWCSDDASSGWVVTNSQGVKDSSCAGFVAYAQRTNTRINNVEPCKDPKFSRRCRVSCETCKECSDYAEGVGIKISSTGKLIQCGEYAKETYSGYTCAADSSGGDIARYCQQSCNTGWCNTANQKGPFVPSCKTETDGGGQFACPSTRVYDSSKDAARSPSDANCCKDKPTSDAPTVALTDAAVGAATTAAVSTTAAKPAGTLTASLTINIEIDLDNGKEVLVFTLNFRKDIAAKLMCFIWQVIVNTLNAGSVVVDFSVVPSSTNGTAGTIISKEALQDTFSGPITLPNLNAKTTGAITPPVVAKANAGVPTTTTAAPSDAKANAGVPTTTTAAPSDEPGMSTATLAIVIVVVILVVGILLVVFVVCKGSSRSKVAPSERSVEVAGGSNAHGHVTLEGSSITASSGNDDARPIHREEPPSPDGGEPTMDDPHAVRHESPTRPKPMHLPNISKKPKQRTTTQLDLS